MASARDDDHTHDTDPAVADTAHSEPGTEQDAPKRQGRPTIRPPRAVRAGDQLGRYTLEEEVGEGGMATVFRARDRELRRDVAVKVLFPHLARRDEVVHRFHREARAAANLEHPNILRIYDVGGASTPTGRDEPDPPYIVMELIRGRSLLGELEQRGPMLAEIVACIGALLADALGAAHAKGIVHRDVKPANVMIATPGGRLLLADFGVARLETEDQSLVTKTGALLGTPAYMSPEQAGGDTATAKSDLYSLGATLYQLSTGTLPYSGNPAKVLAAIAQGALQPAVRRRAAVGPDLSRVIDALMATDPAKRPADAATVATELRAIATAGGLGDPVDELTAYFQAPDEFLKTRTTTVVTAIVSAARSALGESRLPRAMALADRASALAPDDPSVSALIETVTEGGRSSNRKRVVGFAAVGVLAAAGIGFAGVTLLGGDPPSAIVRDAAIALVVPDAGAVVADVIELASIDAFEALPVVDDAGVDAMVIDARRGRPAATDAAILSPPIDAAAAPPIDAAVPMIVVDAAVPETGRIVVENDTWCDVIVDGKPEGRATKGKALAIDAAPGPHTVVCIQRGIPGMKWEQQVDVASGKTVVARGALLAEVAVTISISGDFLMIDRIRYPKGSVAKIKPNRYRAVVITGTDQGGAAGWLQIPRVPACRIRELPSGLVCDP